jgi:hypothetical protein
MVPLVLTGPSAAPILMAAIQAGSNDMNEPRETQQPEEPDEPKPAAPQKEIGGPKGPEPTRYGDWEVDGRCTDF